MSYNLTAVDTTSGPGHLRIYPADKPLVGASALNWPGRPVTRANGSVTEIGASRDVKIYNGSTPVHAPVDVLGFYRWGQLRGPGDQQGRPALGRSILSA